MFAIDLVFGLAELLFWTWGHWRFVGALCFFSWLGFVIGGLLGATLAVVVMVFFVGLGIAVGFVWEAKRESCDELLK